jgi:uncharacterized RDD family membrane protein YckC
MTIPYDAVPRRLPAMPVDRYINEVVRWIPDGKERARIEMDLVTKLANETDVDVVISRYGEPRTLAETYLASVPLETAPFTRRILAAMIDFPSVIVSGFFAFYFAWQVFGPSGESFLAAILTGNPLAIALCFATLILMTPIYYAVAESTVSQTVGKFIMGIRVVRESGAKISVGQALVRQIPLFFSFYLFDAIFALFTSKRQRLFEMISGTRVVRAPD